ncbi:hypothetical protein DYB25_010643 [Aphanomyces astaci]|nr:hypothetical protein DYB25_010643 [Aphanomyces astaci]RHY24468.1 hypothetical protein DYB36_009072 [Aphanomyces astaci]RHZ12158.1 hypothetical protein DYB26_012533 [Aphanomyces astaci]RHZ27718.1 hypothetical protein DYB31_010582 [Aphanomyces astaci]
MPIEDDDQINVLQHDEEEGFIPATSDDIPRSDLECVWILESACTADLTGNKPLFTKLARAQLTALQLADNSTVQSMHMGLLSIQVDADHRPDRPKAKIVPNRKQNLLSFRLLLRDGFQVAKWDLDVVIMILDTFVLTFTHHRGLLFFNHMKNISTAQAARDGSMEGLYLSKSDLAQDYSCEVCEVAKARRMSYKNANPYRTHAPLERVQ